MAASGPILKFAIELAANRARTSGSGTSPSPKVPFDRKILRGETNFMMMPPASTNIIGIREEDMKKALFCAASALVLAWSSWPHAQQPSAGNLEKLSEFKTTGTPLDIPQIPQTGAKADAIKKNLARIKLPRGFKIGLYAIVPDARHIAVGPQGVVTFVGTRKSKVWSVTDRDKDRVADEVKEFAPSIAFALPNGVCFSKDGFLFIAEQNRVLLFPAAEF